MHDITGIGYEDDLAVVARHGLGRDLHVGVDGHVAVGHSGEGDVAAVGVDDRRVDGDRAGGGEGDVVVAAVVVKGVENGDTDKRIDGANGQGTDVADVNVAAVGAGGEGEGCCAAVGGDVDVIGIGADAGHGTQRCRCGGDIGLGVAAVGDRPADGQRDRCGGCDAEYGNVVDITNGDVAGGGGGGERIKIVGGVVGEIDAGRTNVDGGNLQSRGRVLGDRRGVVDIERAAERGEVGIVEHQFQQTGVAVDVDAGAEVIDDALGNRQR